MFPGVLADKMRPKKGKNHMFHKFGIMFLKMFLS